MGDKNFDEENNERPMDQNTSVEENDHDYENTELSPENQLAVVNNSSVSQNKRTCPCISNVWKNLSARTRTGIVAFGCCPCTLIRDLPEVISFFVWLIFFVCALPGK